MRIVIDMQGAQSENRSRSIGRYSLLFAKAVARNRGEREILLALNGSFPDTIEPIRAEFDGLLPQENIRVWSAPGPTAENLPGNEHRRRAAELLREAFLADLEPDIIHVSSLFEGYADDAVTSIGRFDRHTPVSVTLYDSISPHGPGSSDAENPGYERYRMEKIAFLNSADLLFPVSEVTKYDCQTYIDGWNIHIENLYPGIDPQFVTKEIDDAKAIDIRNKFDIAPEFILHTGGADGHKDLSRLIQAFAALPPAVRAGHQLVLTGGIPPQESEPLRRTARSAGLADEDVRFTGSVTDAELVVLYNSCELCVFSSLHEGFGLQALEAMSCGAPVIGADASGLPEVVGLKEALFDPFDVAAISNKLDQTLRDGNFRARLREHGLRQAKLLSWDQTARRAIAAWEALPQKTCPRGLDPALIWFRLCDALAETVRTWEEDEVSDLCLCLARNQQSGIERQLFIDVSALCLHDAATGIQRVVRSYLICLLQFPPTGFRVEPVYASPDGVYRYAHCYQQRFLGLKTCIEQDVPIRWQRGDIFFVLDLHHLVQLGHADFYQKLRSQGVTIKFLVYDLLPIQFPDYFNVPNLKRMHENFLKLIASTEGAICISKSTADAFDRWIEDNKIRKAATFSNQWVHIGADIEGSSPSRGLPPDAAPVLEAMRARPSFLCVATLEPRKEQRQIFHALRQLWDEGKDVNLVLVGHEGWKVKTLAEELRKAPQWNRRLFWLKGISDEYLEKIYSSATCLIAASLNEGFGLPLIEAAQHELPIVARDIPVFREVAGENAYYFTGTTADDLAAALRNWLALYGAGRHPKSDRLPWSTWRESTERLKTALIDENYPRRQLLVDISELVQRDAKTGIQRVVRSILREWLTHPPIGYRVEPVYATMDQGYRYARRFTSDFLSEPNAESPDNPIDYAPGDVFLGLDLQPHIVPANSTCYQELRNHGVLVFFTIYDLLCYRLPQYFLPGAKESFTRWLEVVSRSDGAVCISKCVANEMSQFRQQQGRATSRRFEIKWFHLGADIAKDRCAPEDGSSKERDLLQGRVTFLMVGTLEPRKGHAQVLAAFEELWGAGRDINLVIVGKKGWMIDELVKRLRRHPEKDRHLFWLEGLDDEGLERIYAASTCLIAASYGEGFGLPLIEAAQHGLPVIARDIPVFREVAGDHAFYFDAEDAAGLARAVEAWLESFKAGSQPDSRGMQWLTWQQSAQELLRAIGIG